MTHWLTYGIFSVTSSTAVPQFQRWDFASDWLPWLPARWPRMCLFCYLAPLCLPGTLQHCLREMLDWQPTRGGEYKGEKFHGCFAWGYNFNFEVDECDAVDFKIVGSGMNPVWTLVLYMQNLVTHLTWKTRGFYKCITNMPHVSKTPHH